ncbi:Integrin-linked protein kinase 1 [Camellia lanceoleosa]|uniref:Integrin-linked protein kinase 1 n=1 Tax=Camellia lanceoleosa TaxID=1840588 RepID=A0ACC0G9L8_9ERIC|nr:Integrin-linked protein kinase 1 [Camellia lanceoleosa]
MFAVVQLVGAVTQNLPMMIVSEYHSKGDLGNYLQKKGSLSPSRALKFALDIARGMNYLHECKPDPIFHCDLKPKCQKYFAGLWRSVDTYYFGLILYEMIRPVIDHGCANGGDVDATFAGGVEPVEDGWKDNFEEGFSCRTNDLDPANQNFWR